ncbi:hypothetical protein ACQJBY_038138 [Aegilops geniculata]
MEDSGLDFLLDAVDRFPLQEFADSHEHSDSVPLILLASGGVGATAPADSNAGSGCGQQIVGDGSEAARAGVRRRPESSPTRSTVH